MRIVNMNMLNETGLAQAAQMLTDELPLGWATLAEALEEVNGLLRLVKECDAACGDEHPKRMLIAAMEDDVVIGWCGMLPSYGGRVFELHPMVVRREWQRKGIGTALVRALEDAARRMGGVTMFLGTDDDAPEGQTSLANVDLYADLPRYIREFDPKIHQSAFYMKMGYKVVGVMPDANGKGKPDIFMAKPL